MSRSIDEAAAKLLIETPTTDGLNTLGLANGISGMNLKVYFWQPSDLNLLLANINDVNSKRAHGLGLDQGTDSIQTISPTIKSDVLSVLKFYTDIGAIKSYQVVTSPLDTNNQIADLSFLQPKVLPDAIGRVAISNVGKVPDSNNEVIVGLDAVLENDEVEKLRLVVLHEIGHALGFSHPFNVSGILYKYDNFKYTMMSYNHNDHSAVPDSPMLLDYLALQQAGLLGAYHTGDDVFIRSSSSGFYHTIYDTVGKDSISAEGQQKAVIIDLRDGHFSSYGADINGKAPLENLAIAYDTIIENAIGSDKDDVIIGNSTANNIKGGKGDDFLYGNGLNYDTKNWKFSQAHKNAYAATVDTVNNNIDDKDTIYGGDGNDYIDGQSGNDTLYGDDGHDFIFGGFGDDSIEGGKGSDHIYGGDGKFSVVEGNDTIDGGEGNDILEGGAGNDKYIFKGTFGRDVINDSDNTGSIEIDGTPISQFTQTSTDSIIYYDNVKNPTRKAVVIKEGDSQSLIISTVTKSGNSIIDSGNSITIKNWTGSGLGITLNAPATETVDTSHKVTLNGTTTDNVLSTLAYWDDELAKGKSPAQIDYAARLFADGGSGKDLLIGTLDGSDSLSGGGDDDIISSGRTASAGLVADPLENIDSQGTDTINGGKGNDYITVTGKNAIVHGNEDNDIIDADNIFDGVVFSTTYYDSAANKSTSVTRDQVWTDLRSHLNPAYSSDATPVFTYADKAKDSKSFIKNSSSAAGASYYYMQWPGSSSRVQFGLFYTDKEPVSYGYDSRGYPVLSVESPARLQSYIISNNRGTRKIADYQNLTGHTLFGDAGNDTITGSIMSDYISGGDNQDSLWGLDGHDLLDGGADKDTISGGSGRDTLIGGEGDDKLYGNNSGMAEANLPDDDVLYGGKGNDTLSGDELNDYLDGGTGTDELYGGDGNDYLYGGDDTERDTLSGGAGNDTLVMGVSDVVAGHSGNDIYIWDTHQVTTTSARPQSTTTTSNNAGFGDASSSVVIIDTIAGVVIDTEGSDNIVLTGVTDFSNTSLMLSGNDVYINTGRTNSLAIRDGVFNNNINITTAASAEQAVALVPTTTSLTDDTFLSGTDFLAQSQLSLAGFVLSRMDSRIAVTGATAGDYLVGGSVSDSLTAHAGGSRMVGGRGDDALNGDVSSDVYLIRKGDGNDIITEKGGTNTIKFDKNISVNDVKVNRSGADLILKISDEQAITVKNMFDANTGAVVSTNAVQSVIFYDTTSWDITTLKQKALINTDSADVIGGFDSADTIKGGKGNDQLNGGAGNDVYQYALGDGVDEIIDATGTDRIDLSGGILSSMVTALRDANNNLVLRISDGGRILIRNAFDSSGNFTANAIETIKFSDSSTWDATRIKQEVAKDPIQIINGTLDNDSILGDSGKDSITGGKGNDQIAAGAGNDIYKYSLGDGKDIISDIGGTDRIELGTGITPTQTFARANGSDLVLTLSDGGSITVKDMFAKRSSTPIDPLITAIIQELQTNWISQAEALIETNYGLKGSGDLTVKFIHDAVGGEDAAVKNKSGDLTLEIDVEDFNFGGGFSANGVGASYNDRTIAHEMVHATMMRYMDLSIMPGWFTEGTAEFIHGADRRSNLDLYAITDQAAFNNLFKTTAGSPATSAGYTVSYIAVKLLDAEIRAQGGEGIKEVFTELKTGNTLDQALANVSAAHGGMNGDWNNLTTLQSHVSLVGFSKIDYLLNLTNSDTGSIAGSDYGNNPLDDYDVLPNKNTGPSKYFNVIIPAEYYYTPDIENNIETIKFSDNTTWNLSQINAEVLKGTKTGTTGPDTLIGTLANDTLVGSTGNDELNGGAGDDVYRYSLNDGFDVITDTSGIDRIELGSGITQDDVYFLRLNDKDLFLNVRGYGVSILNALNLTDELNPYAIDSVKFEDGTVWKLSNIFPSPSWGTVGNDSLNGSSNNDTLIGGKGDDTVIGGKGDDIYRYFFGDGNDTIIDVAGTDAIEFDSSVEDSQIDVERDAYNNLLITLPGGSTITVVNAFDSQGEFTSDAIESLKFYGSGAWDQTKIKQRLKAPGVMLNGTIKDDRLDGGTGDDTLTGGKGNDVLSGDKGNDIYVFNLGDGHDEIGDIGGIDTIKFGTGITKNDLIFHINDQYVIISIGKSDSISLGPILSPHNDMSGSFNYQYLSEKIQFSDGSLLDIEQAIRASVNQASVYTEYYSEEAYYYGLDSDDKLTGTNGIDHLYGQNGNDTLQAGSGNDYLFGGRGNDVYKFNIGEGSDTIGDYDGVDVLEFGAGIYEDQVSVSVDSGSVIFTIETGESVTVDDMLYTATTLNSTYSIESIKFSNNVTWDQQKILSELLKSKTGIKLVGTSANDSFAGSVLNDTLSGGDLHDVLTGDRGNDILSGDSGNDTLFGGSGSDTLLGYIGDDFLQGGMGYDSLNGGAGNDIYYFEQNNGKDTLEDSSGADVIRFGAGINSNSVTLKTDGYRTEINYGGNNSVVVYDMFDHYGNSNNYLSNGSIERFEFANGDIWNFDQIKSHLDYSGTPYNDTLVGFVSDDTINGGGGNDYLSGGAGNDVIVGGTDADRLIGGTGINTYLYNLGDGYDSISYLNSGLGVLNHDVLKFGVGISSNDVKVSTTDEGIRISISDSDVVNVNIKTNVNFYVQFSDGTVWGALELITKSLAGTGNNIERPGQPKAAFNSGGKVVSGSAPAGSRISIQDASSFEIGTGTVNSSGSYSITLATALINNEIINVFAEDATGNASLPKTIIAPDLTKPSQPSAYFDTTGKIVSGSAEAGSTVSIKNASSVEIGSGTANSSGNYSITLSKALVNKEIVTVTAMDASGNVSTPVNATAPLLSTDTTPPVLTSAKFDTAGKIVSGSAEAGATISVKNSSGSEVGTGIVNSSGSYSVTLSVALINKETVNVTAKDAAGNISSPVAATAPDKTPPSAPAAKFDTTGKIISGTAEASSRVYFKDAAGNALGDVKVSSSGTYQFTLATALINKEVVNATAKDAAGNYSDLTYATAPDLTKPSQPTAYFDSTGKIVSGNAEAGSTVSIKNVSGTEIGSGTATSSGTYSITLGTALINKEVVSVTAADASKNVSTPVNATAPLLSTDTTPPVLTSAKFDTAGKIVSGSAEAGATISVKNSSGLEVGTGTVNSTGSYSVTLSVALVNKETVNVTAKDAAGNFSTPIAAIAPDKTPPSAPVAKFDTTGKIISGTAEASSRVYFKDASGNALGDVKAGSSGGYQFTLTTAMVNGQTISAVAKDAAGNYSDPTYAKAPVITQSVTASTLQKTSASTTSSAQADAMVQAMASFAPPVSAETKPLVGYADVNPPLLVVSH